MSPSHVKSWFRAVRWLAPAAALAFAPKCLLCVLAYAGLGAVLGLGGRELCGAPAESPVQAIWPVLVLAGVAISTSVLVAHRRREQPTTGKVSH